MFSLKGPHPFPETVNPQAIETENSQVPSAFAKPLGVPGTPELTFCGDLFLECMRPIPALPFSSWPALTSRVFCRICSRRIRKWPGSLLTSSCRLQQFRHSPAGKGQRGQWSVWGWREVGKPGAILGIPFSSGSQKIHNQHSTLPCPIKHNDKFCIPGSSRDTERGWDPLQRPINQS